MKVLYTQPSNGKIKVITMEHNDQQIEWCIQNYRNFQPNESTFGDMNYILNSLSKEDQDRLWQIYFDASHVMLTTGNLFQLDKKLSSLLRSIEEIVPYSYVKKKILFKGTLWLPSDTTEVEEVETTLDSFAGEEVVTMTTRVVTGLTYTEEDIGELFILKIYLKFYFPILAEYYNVVGVDTVDFFRCTKTISLLNNCNFIHTGPYQRLHDYVNFFWMGRNKTADLNPSILLKGLSPDGVVSWMLDELVFRKLLPMAVSHKYEEIDERNRPNFLKGLFHNADAYSKLLVNGNRQGQRQNDFFMDKSNVEEDIGSDGENQLSVLEVYKMVAEVDEKVIVLNNYFLENEENFRGVLEFFGCTLSEMLDVQYMNGRHRSRNPFRDVIMNMLVTRIGMNENNKDKLLLISPQIVPYLNQKAYSNIFKYCYCVLNKMGYDDLADLFDGHGEFDDTESREFNFNVIDVTSEQIRRLDEYYPYLRTTRNMKGLSRRESNITVSMIDDIITSVNGIRIQTTNRDGFVTCKDNVKYRFADFIIRLNEMKFL